ncbi:L-threonylcarbamoyladenylate synthase [Endothiovibrio diazotrophicus]
MAGELALRLAGRALRSGGVVAHPTEAVYGLACDPLDARAVARLLALKGRSVEKGLILVASSFEALRPFVAVPDDAALARAAASWPGPVTWLFPAAPTTPRWLTGRHVTLAVRVTAHPLTRALCDAFGGPLISTSANPAGRPPPRSAVAVRRYFGTSLDGVLNGPLGDRARPSEIRDLVSGRILRAG